MVIPKYAMLTFRFMCSTHDMCIVGCLWGGFTVDLSSPWPMMVFPIRKTLSDLQFSAYNYSHLIFSLCY